MYGLTEIQLMNTDRELIPVPIRQRSSPSDLRRYSIAALWASRLLMRRVADVLSDHENPPITEGDRWARQEAK